MAELLAKLLELLPDWIGWSCFVIVFGGLGAAWLYQTLTTRRPPAGPAADSRPRPPSEPPSPPAG